MDEAHIETEEILKSLERRINAVYRKAEAELQEKLDDYLRRFEIKDETWQKWVQNKQKTQREYNDWRMGQMAIGERWSNQKRTIAKGMAKANQTARSIVSKEMPDVYALNHNYGTYEVEKGSLIDTGYVLYNHDAVEGLFEERKIYHDPGRTTLNKVAQGLEQKWNRQNVQSAMVQGILQGESIPKIATRIADTVGEKNRKAAIRNARTITTGVQNKGRIDSYDRANKMGIETQKQWIATLDGRTRHTHREMDGETVPNDDVFSNGCEYPGDPGGDPAEIYNCRCTLIASIKGFERDASDLSDRRNEKLGDMSYDEWKEAHSTSQDILHGEKVGKTMQGYYTGQYKGINYARAIDKFIMSDDLGDPSITPETILEALQQSPVGIETIRHIRDSKNPIYISQEVQPNTYRGQEQDGIITLFEKNLEDSKHAAQTVVHEVTHTWYNIGNCQHAEAICYAREKMFIEGRDYITKNEWEDIVSKVKDAYWNLEWEKGGYGDFKQFDFIR